MSYPYTWKPNGNLNSDYLPLPKTLVACQKNPPFNFSQNVLLLGHVHDNRTEFSYLFNFLPSLVSCQVLVAPYAQWIREDCYEGYLFMSLFKVT